jgi:catechol 2,3-dioxygenase-like lactoylglutathione lyase family enzyme
MTQESILGASKVVAFAPVTDAARARAFYEGVLGLRLVEDQKPFAMVFDANGTTLRVTPVGEFKPQPFTVLGWEVESIETTVERLTAAGVVFMRIPGMNDADPLGIWTAPGGARIAWFKDPDGNVLSVGCTQSAAADLAWVAAEVMVGCGRDGGWGWRSQGGPPSAMKLRKDGTCTAMARA